MEWSEVEGWGGVDATGRRGPGDQGCIRNAAWRWTSAVQVIDCYDVE